MVAEFDLFYDLPAAPTPPGGNFVQGYFEHPEWNLITGSKFNTDYISPIQEGNSHTWNLKISGETEDDINLSWNNEITELPENYTITLLVNGTTEKTPLINPLPTAGQFTWAAWPITRILRCRT